MGDDGDTVLAQLLAQVDTTDVAVPGQYQRKGLRTRALRKEKAGAAADDDKAQADKGLRERPAEGDGVQRMP